MAMLHTLRTSGSRCTSASTNGLQAADLPDFCESYRLCVQDERLDRYCIADP